MQFCLIVFYSNLLFLQILKSSNRKSIKEEKDLHDVKIPLNQLLLPPLSFSYCVIFYAPRLMNKHPSAAKPVTPVEIG